MFFEEEGYYIVWGELSEIVRNTNNNALHVLNNPSIKNWFFYQPSGWKFATARGAQNPESQDVQSCGLPIKLTI